MGILICDAIVNSKHHLQTLIIPYMILIIIQPNIPQAIYTLFNFYQSFTCFVSNTQYSTGKSILHANGKAININIVTINIVPLNTPTASGLFIIKHIYNCILHYFSFFTSIVASF